MDFEQYHEQTGSSRFKKYLKVIGGCALFLYIAATPFLDDMTNQSPQLPHTTIEQNK